MKKELDQKLCADFPEIFRDRRGNPKDTAMCWGFSVNDGWFDIIYKLCESLNRLKHKPIALQVKEKFGGLRFYVQHPEGTTAEEVKFTEDRISFTERMSYFVCEDCGTTRDVVVDRASRWITTKCKSCLDKADTV